MSASRSLKVVQPQTPARIKVKKAEKKLVTVVLTEEDFEPGEEAYPGLSVTCNTNIPFSTMRMALGMVEAGDSDDPKARIAAAAKSMDVMTRDILQDWNLDDDETGRPMSISKVEDLPAPLFQAVMKAIMKAIGAKPLSPN